jgi:translation initiation factor 1
MAKKRPPRKDAAPQPDAGPFHSAFAGLASLRDQLPEGDASIDTPAPAVTVDGPVVPSKVVVRRERKGRKGKTVTRISGFGTDVAGWARRMKQELGCGGSVEDDDIILAGDLGDRVARWLEAAGIRRVVR